MTFDVTDKQYQLSDDIKPDKESTWKYPKEKDGKRVGSFPVVVVELSRVESRIMILASNASLPCLLAFFLCCDLTLLLVLLSSSLMMLIHQVGPMPTTVSVPKCA
jgi:hypothetical protein